MPLCHFAVAVKGASWTDPDSIPLMVMQSILGSWNKNVGAGKNMGCAIPTPASIPTPPNTLTESAQHQLFNSKTKSNPIRSKRSDTHLLLNFILQIIKKNHLAQLSVSSLPS